MPFSYVASTPKGNVRRGSSDLPSENAVAEWLDSKGWVVISIDETKVVGLTLRLQSLLFGTISQVDKTLITKHLSIMLKAGLSLVESLQILVDQAGSWRVKTMLKTIVRRVERGEKLSDALAAYPQVFSPFFINIVRSGELSGTLEESLDHLAVQYGKDHELLQKVRSAMLYPTIVLIAAALIGFFFATYVLPQVASLFRQLHGVQLPWITLLLLDVAGFVRAYTVFSFVAFFGGIAFVIWLARWKVLAPFTHLAILRLPIISPIVKNLNLARFSLILGTLLSSGIDITRSLEITSSVLTNIYYKRALEKILVQVQRGQPLSEALARYSNLFSLLTTRMINVGERAGKLEEVLQYLADFYELEVETTMKNLATVLEPILLLLIGLVALAMAYSILIPIYNFISAIGKI